MSQLFTWRDQSTGVSASASVLPKNIQDWSPLEWTGWISLQSKELSRVFSNTTVQKHQFFGAQLSSQSNSHIHTRPLEKPEPWLDGSVVSNSLRPHELYPARLLCPWESPGKNIGVDCNTLLQGIFLTQGSNPGLLHYRWILYSWATGKVHMQCSLAF